MKQQEIYPNAPLRLVSLEVKFPLTSRVLTRAVWDGLEEALGELLPEVQVLVEDPDSRIPRKQHEPVLRRISRDHKRAVTLYAGAVTVELADYRRYQDLRKLTEATLNALSHTPSDFLRCTRMGLRFINEVKFDLLQNPSDEWHHHEAWMPYINNDLVNGIEKAPPKLCAFAHRGIAYFHTIKGDEQVSLDYGIHPEGTVDLADVLTLEGTSGPCFVLDIDAYRYNSSNEEPPGNQELIGFLDNLHDAVENVFQWSITDQMREVFRAPVQSRSDESLPSASNG